MRTTQASASSALQSCGNLLCVQSKKPLLHPVRPRPLFTAFQLTQLCTVHSLEGTPFIVGPSFGSDYGFLAIKQAQERLAIEKARRLALIGRVDARIVCMICRDPAFELSATECGHVG